MSSSSASDSCAPIRPRLALILFFAVLLLSIPQAALLPLLDRDEPRFAEASREMLQSGNYVVPTFNGAPRYAKPPLIYWCQTVCYRLFGENAFAARLPSLLATAATAVLLLTWGTRLGSEAVGLGAGLCYAFCLQTVQQGRVATADALLIFFMTLTAFTGWRILQARDRVQPVCLVVLALAFAGGFLAKGPEALIPMVPLLWCARRSSRALIVGILASFLVGLALVLLWAIPAYIQTNGEYWDVGLRHDVYERAVGGDFQGHGASSIGWYLLGVPLYLLLFWVSALPWSPLIALQRRKLFTAWKTDLTDTYLILNAGLVFLIFSLMVTKLPHYTLPAFPFLALLVARRWQSVGLPTSVPIKLGWIAGGAFTVLALIGIPIAIANHATPSPVGTLVQQAGTSLTPDTQFALVDFEEPNAIWEMRRVVKGYSHTITDLDVSSCLNHTGPHAVLLSTETWSQLRIRHAMSEPEWKFYEARGFNAAKGKSIDLTLVVKP
jgi:4-amino-4-deoxy-L-arabinose transferase-like glycosyltransferase